MILTSNLHLIWPSLIIQFKIQANKLHEEIKEKIER